MINNFAQEVDLPQTSMEKGTNNKESTVNTTNVNMTPNTITPSPSTNSITTSEVTPYIHSNVSEAKGHHNATIQRSGSQMPNEYIINYGKLELGAQIGSGFFGVVYK